MLGTEVCVVGRLLECRPQQQPLYAIGSDVEPHRRVMCQKKISSTRYTHKTKPSLCLETPTHTYVCVCV